MRALSYQQTYVPLSGDYVSVLFRSGGWAGGVGLQAVTGHTSTHLSGVLVQTLVVVTLAVGSRHQAPAVLVLTHAAAAVTGACQGETL